MKAEEGKLPRVTMKNRAKVAQSGPSCHWVVDVAMVPIGLLFQRALWLQGVFSAVIAPQGPEVVGG